VTPIDQMTEDEVREYLAECLGWVRINKGSVPVEVPAWERRTRLPSGGVGVEESWCCPVPASLDSAAGCLPEGYLLRCHVNFPPSPVWHGHEKPWWGMSVQKWDNGWVSEKIIAGDQEERPARFRAAAKAWAVVRKESGR
jgi:hypothetical protein